MEGTETTPPGSSTSGVWPYCFVMWSTDISLTQENINYAHWQRTWQSTARTFLMAKQHPRVILIKMCILFPLNKSCFSRKYSSQLLGWRFWLIWVHMIAIYYSKLLNYSNGKYCVLPNLGGISAPLSSRREEQCSITTESPSSYWHSFSREIFWPQRNHCHNKTSFGSSWKFQTANITLTS